MEKLIGLADLPDTVRIRLDDSFRKKLFRKAIENSKVVTLAKELNCHTDTLLHIRKGRFSLKTTQLKKLSDLIGISLNEIETHVTELNSKKRRIKIELPIFSSPQLASLIGHCISDGTLSEKQFSFFNKQRDLVDEVIKNTKIAFSTNVEPVEFEKDGGWEIEFPTNIARLLALTGCPVGEKVFIPFSIPGWIKNGTDEIKVAFIRALIDDEGSISSKLNKTSKSVAREIKFAMSKNEKFLESHMNFLEDVRSMLLDLGVGSSSIHKLGVTRNGIFMGFSISRFENLSRFLEVVNLTSREKKRKLIRCLNEFKAFDNDLTELKLENPHIFKV